MRRLLLIIGFLAVAALSVTLCNADTFKLASGEEVTGEALISSATEAGVQIKVGEGQYKRVPWSQFSQDDLKKFAQYKKVEDLVQPFIEITQEEKIAKTEAKIKPAPRFDRPAKQSLIGALFSSPVGVFMLFVLWAATIYAGYEVAIYRAQPPMLVAGLSAVPFLGIAAPIAFLCMRTKMPTSEAVVGHPTAEGAQPSTPGSPAPVAAGTDPDNPMQAAGAPHPAGLKLAATTDPESDKPAIPEPVVFQRGQFTFNRRFIETKFAGFFGAVKRDSAKDMVLVIKSLRGEYVGTRISRIAPNDMHLQVQHGGASNEVQIPFVEIREIILRHQDSKS